MNDKKKLIMSCLVEGDFTLHSGEKSNYLFDIMKLSTSNEFIFHYSYFVEMDHCLVGIEFGGAILAALGMPFTDREKFAIVRKDGTIYGDIPDDYTLIDDVVTTENSIRKAIEQIGKEPSVIKCIVDRRKIKTLNIESMLMYK